MGGFDIQWITFNYTIPTRNNKSVSAVRSNMVPKLNILLFLQ